MSRSESNARRTAVDSLEVVVGVGDVQISSVFIGIAVGVADKGGFVVVVEVDVADCYPVAGVGYLCLLSVGMYGQ